MYNEYLEPGQYHNMDGDIVDGRTDMIKELRREVVGYRLKEKREKELRLRNLALQEAYDKYQTILRLVDND